jgi:hypothetical protein
VSVHELWRVPASKHEVARPERGAESTRSPSRTRNSSIPGCTCAMVTAPGCIRIRYVPCWGLAVEAQRKPAQLGLDGAFEVVGEERCRVCVDDGRGPRRVAHGVSWVGLGALRLLPGAAALAEEGGWPVRRDSRVPLTRLGGGVTVPRRA